MEGAPGDPAWIPDELPSLLSFIHVFIRKTNHPFALAAKQGHVRAGLEVILHDLDGGFLRVDFSAVEQGTNHFTEMATGALCLVDPNFHCLIQVAAPFFFWGFPVRPSHEAGSTHRALHQTLFVIRRAPGQDLQGSVRRNIVEEGCRPCARRLRPRASFFRGWRFFGRSLSGLSDSGASPWKGGSGWRTACTAERGGSKRGRGNGTCRENRQRLSFDREP